jgi:hypothetical protein
MARTGLPGAARARHSSTMSRAGCPGDIRAGYSGRLLDTNRICPATLGRMEPADTLSASRPPASFRGRWDAACREPGRGVGDPRLRYHGTVTWRKLPQLPPARAVGGRDPHRCAGCARTRLSLRTLGTLGGESEERAAARSEETRAKRIALQVLFFGLGHNMLCMPINAAKGGDPMSHGSAEGSVKFVRELRF